MDPQARSRLAAAARRYLAAAPWKLVGDDYVFGIHDRTGGKFGGASVMGGAGIEYGLEVKLGVEGFRLLQKFLEDELDFSTVKAKTDGVAFSVTALAPAAGAFEKLRPFLVDEQKVCVEGKHGHPTVWRLVPGEPLRPLDSEDAAFLGRCLGAVAHLAEQGRLGQDRPRDGERVLVWNVTEQQDGKLATRRSYRTLDDVDVQHPKVVLEDDLKRALLARPRHEGRYFATVFTPPVSVQGGIVWTALVLDDSGRPVFTWSAPAFVDAARTIFEAFAGRQPAGSLPGLRVPREVVTDSFPVFESLKDAMLELEVRLLSREDVPELATAKESLASFLARG